MSDVPTGVFVSASDPATINDASDYVAPTASSVATVDAPAAVEAADATDTGDLAVDGEARLVDHEVDTPLIEAIDVHEIKDAVDQDEEGVVDNDFAPDVLDMEPTELRGVLEALLLVATKPMKIERIEKCLPGSRRKYLEGFLRGMAERYTRDQRGWDLRQIGGGWQLLTRVHFHPWVRQLDKKELPTKLSKSAMETLAIVAYKQPVARGKIEDIRGVQCGPMLRQLMDMHLVQVVGRDDDALGRPLLYGTSEKFLERFGLSSPEDLPRQHEFGG